jgi:hypothetical protein
MMRMTSAISIAPEFLGNEEEQRPCQRSYRKMNGVAGFQHAGSLQLARRASSTPCKMQPRRVHVPENSCVLPAFQPGMLYADPVCRSGKYEQQPNATLKRYVEAVAR